MDSLATTSRFSAKDKIGPKIGKELRTSALMAVLWALGAILIYIGLRLSSLWSWSYDIDFSMMY